jgi:hypothetical protein
MSQRRPISSVGKWSVLALGACFALCADLRAQDHPEPASFRSAFEAQFPKSEASAGALELERLAAALGFELAPFETQPAPDRAETTPGDASEPAVFALKVEKQRPRPSPEAKASLQAVSGMIGQFLDRELKTPEERIGPLPSRFQSFLEEHDAAAAALESMLVRRSDLRWEIDVSQGSNAPIPTLGGIMRLQRFLGVRALAKARRGETDAALQALEAAWRLNEAVSARPELISQLIAVAAAKITVGVLRKLDSPAYGWADRLRGGDLFSAYLASFQNQVWYSSDVYSSDVRDLTGEAGAYGRVLRNVAEEFEQRDLCSWTPDRMQESWNRAVQNESRDGALIEMAVPNLLESFARWRRFQIDAELTALVLDARAERAASRRRDWPSKLHSIGASVCPGEPWTYRNAGNGTATFAFEGRITESPSAALRLPLGFTAGTPRAPAPRAPKSTSRKD